MKIFGWILDAYPVPEGMCIWMVDLDGRAIPVLDPWAPTFYFKTESDNASSIGRLLESFKSPFLIETIEKKDFFTESLLSVSSIRLSNPLLFSSIVDRLLKMPEVVLFNADINVAQSFFYERNLFPLAFCEVKTNEKGVVQEWHLQDSPWTLDYPLPPLRMAHLGFESTGGDPNHQQRGRHRGRFLLTLGKNLGEGTTYVMDGGEEELLLSLNRRISDWDPDILLTDWGDSFLMPRLELFSQRTGVPLLLSRDSSSPKFSIGDPAALKTLDSRQRHSGMTAQYSGMTAQKSRSYFSYGKMIFKAGSRTLFGRLHIDTRNSFNYAQTGLEGLFEIARVAKIPLQRAARCTIGTSLSSMQHDWALRNNYLIPLDKGQTEDFRPAEDLIASDRGGLVYEPEIGWHEDLIEFDFVSMYPEIMIRHNITPEAINCACCPDNKVPEINHHICCRIGMIPAVLKPLVEKRAQYKGLIRDNHPKSRQFQQRRDAFKWALVTCFGYLGFRNARFGRIEAHECVNAYSREALLKAKEVAEAEGFHFVHAIVDSLWLKKPGVTDAEVESLRKKIEEAAGLPLGYEGRYRWIRFCPSRTNSLVGVPNRYFGVFKTGVVKVRGIELRRHDTPPFIKTMQENLLRVMAESDSLAGLRDLKDKLEGMVEEMFDRLKNGQISPFDLAISVHLRRAPDEYLHDTLSAIAAKKLAASGIHLHPGETIQYVVAEEHDQVKDWRVMPLALIDETFEFDRAYYARLLERAVGSVLSE